MSTATVSRALHDPESPFVSQSTRQRVRLAADTLGYVANQSGRALATGRSKLVSFWVNDPYAAYYARVAHQLHQETVRRGFHPMIRMTSNLSRDPVDWCEPDGLADGIIVVDVGRSFEMFLDARPGFRTPMVSIGVIYSKRVDHVKVDLRMGALEAVRHLMATRSGRIVALMFDEQDPRTVAYRDAMRDAGRPAEVVMVPDETRATNRRLATELVADRGLPDAFFCQNDDVALAVYRVMCDLGVRVPDDVALVGCDGIEDGEYLSAPLSTIIHPQDEMVRLAWQFLERRIESPGIEIQSATLPSRLVVRASSTPAGTPG